MMEALNEKIHIICLMQYIAYETGSISIAYILESVLSPASTLSGAWVDTNKCLMSE